MPVTRGARRLRTFTITVLVLIVLVVIADRGGAWLAGRLAGDTIQSAQHLDSRPDVDIAGIPFLTQLAAGDFAQITVTAHDVPIGEQDHQLDLSQLRVVLHDVTVPRNLSSVTAQRATASAYATYAALGKAIGIDVRYVGNGRITATKSVTIAGQTVTGSITTRPSLVNGALGFTATAVNGLGSLSQDVSDVLGRVFDLSVPLQGFPFGVRVQSLHADATGVTMVLTGVDLTYRR